MVALWGLGPRPGANDIMHIGYERALGSCGSNPLETRILYTNQERNSPEFGFTWSGDKGVMCAALAVGTRPDCLSGVC